MNLYDSRCELETFPAKSCVNSLVEGRSNLVCELLIILWKKIFSLEKGPSTTKILFRITLQKEVHLRF